MLKKIACATISSLIATLPLASLAAEKPDVRTGKAPAHVPGEIIVKFKEENISVRTFLNKHSIRETEKVEKVRTSGKIKAAFDSRGVNRIYTVRLDDSANFEKELEKIKKDPSVEYAEPNYILSVDAVPNDPSFSQLWGFHNTGQTGGTADADIDAVEAWDTIHDATITIVVGIIDTGIDYNHEDLVDNIWQNPGEIAGNGIDDDANGFIDDIYGWNFITNTNNVMDDHGHGTHVSGTIAGRGNNGKGVAGVNWTGKIAALKFLSAQGSGTTADAVEAIQYATAMGMKITNNSWGGGGFSLALQDAIASANAAGHLFVAAAGNQGFNSALYPAAYDVPNIISVAASDSNDNLAGFSNYSETNVDLAAPGVGIYSTVPTTACALCDTSGYKSLSGTSMATPHVSGAVALLWSFNPSLTHLQIKSQIMNLTDIKPALRTKMVSEGRLNIGNLYNDLSDVIAPSAITNLNASADGQFVMLSWTAVGDDGLTGVANRYEVRYSLSPITESNFSAASKAMSVQLPSASGTSENYTVWKTLTTNTQYYFAIKTLDNRGNASAISNVVNVTTGVITPSLYIKSQALVGSPGSGAGWRVVGADQFDGLYGADILWAQNSGDQAAVWTMNGSTMTSGYVVNPDTTNYGTGWSVAGAGTFDTAYPQADILWQRSNGAVGLSRYWPGSANGYVFQPVGIQTGGAAGWSVKSTRNFDSDGYSDILWQNNSDDTPAVWIMNPAVADYSSGFALGSPGAGVGWRLVGAGDFNGDAHSDLLWQNKTDDTPALWLMNGTTIVSTHIIGSPGGGAGWNVVGSADFNNDGKHDILWQNKTDDTPAVWLMNGSTILAQQTLGSPGSGAGWRVVGAADFDGDLRADILWQSKTESNAQPAIWLIGSLPN